MIFSDEHNIMNKYLINNTQTLKGNITYAYGGEIIIQIISVRDIQLK